MKTFSFTAIVVFALATASGDAQTVLNLAPSRVVGQAQLALKSTNPNLVEGREFWNPWSVAVDTSSNPAPLYVADTLNHRILAWRNSASFANGSVADLVIGQVDKQTTSASNAASATRRAGFVNPAALAVDKSGNLYVVDTGNNRILRFPKPFGVTDDPRVPDFVIGQTSFTAATANPGGISATTISTTASSRAATSGLAFDPAGNLWFTDGLNHRVLRYPASALASGSPNGPAADLVLGQPGFTTATAPGATAANRIRRDVLRFPGSIAVDSANRVYVGDDLQRVVVYEPPFTNGKEGSRLVGIQAGTGPVTVSEFLIAQPLGLFLMNDRLGVVDSGLHRILIYDSFPNWSAPTDTQLSPRAQIVLGQPSFTSSNPNRAQAQPSADSLAGPFAAAFSGSELFVADAGNNRVLVFPSLTSGAPATRVLGQTDFSFSAPNLVEGRELYIYSAGADFPPGGGVALDSRGVSPRLYISDTFNNRILGYADARKVRPGDKADIVIGQGEFGRSSPNAPASTAIPTEGGLFRPIGLAVASNGDLFVADAGNSRVLRFPSPFDNFVAGERLRPNLVLGQANFTSRQTDASVRTMAYPYGVALTVEGNLVVSDTIHNRVLYFQKPAGADFVSGSPANTVIGQPDFTTTGRGTAQTNFLNAPGHLSLDTDDRLYVTDPANSRLMVYNRVTTAANNPTPAFILTGVGSPQGVYASPYTGEIWVADTRGNRALRFPRFDQLGLSQASNYTIPSNAPLALTQDSLGNLYVGEAANRVSIYYNGIATQVAGNFLSRPLSPGGIGIIYPRGDSARFGTRTEAFSSLPMPTTLADVQVLLNDQPVPLYFVSPGQINFLVPMSAPESGFAEYQVIQASTGQVLGAGQVEAQQFSPALFIVGNIPQGQVAALNQNNTVNSVGNKIGRGEVIQVFATGQGRIANAPPDGTAPSGQTATSEKPKVLIGAAFVDDADIQYSGLAPSLVGVWQINVKIPDRAPSGDAIDFVVQIGSQFSNGAGVLPGNTRLKTTIAIR